MQRWWQNKYLFNNMDFLDKLYDGKITGRLFWYKNKTSLVKK